MMKLSGTGPLDVRPILDRIAEGDNAAFASIVEHFQHPLFGFFGRMGLTQSAAEEVAQETFLRAWRKIDDYRPERGAFSTWLFTIARNLALNELSRPIYKEGWTTDDALDGVPCGGAQPLDVLLAAGGRRSLRRALMTLPLADRRALALAYVQDLDLASVARIEGCTTGAIKVRLHRSRQRLKQMLEKVDG
jgi:RNA polymerase sigma-70 factor (ECF subfamily)